MAKNTTLRGLKYYGGKSPLGGKSKWISSIIGFDSQKSYVEPFAGMLGVLLCRDPVKVEVASDANGDIINWWVHVRDHPDELARLIDLTPYSRGLFVWAREGLREKTYATELERAYMLHIVVEQSMMHGPAQRSDGWSVAYNPSVGSRGKWDGSRFRPLSDRLINVQLETKDAASMLRSTQNIERAVIYCDPPYRTASTSPYGDVLIDWEELGELFQQQKGMLAISGYNDEWDELGFNRHEYSTITRSVNKGVTGRKRPRVEVLWTNF